MVNLGVTEGLLILGGIVPCIIYLSANPEGSILPILVVALALAVLGPVAFYPFSRTVWAAIDLIIRPLEAREPRDRS